MKTPTHPKAWLFACALLFNLSATQASTAKISSTTIHATLTPTQTRHYNHRPLLIHLKPHAERWITFPGRVQVDARGSGLTHGMLRLLNNQGTLYFTAYQPFSKRRLLVRLLKTGKTLLVDVQSDTQGSITPMRVSLRHHYSHSKHNTPNKPHQPTQHRTVNLVQLMRFAIQQLYFPEHSRHPFKGHLIQSMPLTTSAKRHHADILSRLFSNKSLKLTQQTQWQTTTGPHTLITAIQIHNKSPTKITLHPERLRGHFKAASLYPYTTLGGNKSQRNDTTLFLISDKSSHRAIGGDT